VSKPLFIDLFAGCGGLSLGLVKAGWRGVFAIEKSPDAFNTLRHNLQSKRMNGFKWPKWLACKPMTTNDLLHKHRSDLVALNGNIDLIAGGPPCQGFSTAGKRNPSDPRNRLTEEYIEIVNLVRPKYLLLENVRGFKSAFKNSDEPAYAKTVQDKLENLRWGGYQIYSSMVDASLFGVPQPRPRFIMIGVRYDIVQKFGEISDPVQLAKQSASSFRAARKLNGHNITVKEAISDLEIFGKSLIESPDTLGFKQIGAVSTNKMTEYQALMRKGVKEDYLPNSLRLPRHKEATIQRFVDVLENCPKGIALSKEDRERFGTKKQSFVPLAPNQLSRTITTLPDDHLHYSEPRILTVRENARLQSFPDWFEFLGKYTTGGNRRKKECPRYTQVGNAVPPLMAEALGRVLIKQKRSHEKT